jgi:hypothetical protein
MADGQQWEYRTLELPTVGAKLYKNAGISAEALAAINELGADGWEAVGITPMPGVTVRPTVLVLLKRPRREGDG